MESRLYELAQEGLYLSNDVKQIRVQSENVPAISHDIVRTELHMGQMTECK